MEIQKKKCSLKEHADINANIYCKKCEIYMCNKCEVHHSKLFENHQNFITNKNIEELNDEFCKEENHSFYKLQYYCTTHKQLCCAACIAKIKGKNNGQHSECIVSDIEDIKEEKKNAIKNNIKILEELSSKFNESFNNIKKIFEEINENKEQMKLHIQKIFTNIRNILNNREDELLENVDKEFEKEYFKDKDLKDFEKLPNKINLSLEKCKNIEKIEDNIYKLLKESTEIENNIKLITKWILETINKKVIKFELIFKMSENGTKSTDFHTYCDNKGPTLILVKTTKNKIFGGFTPLNWKNEGDGIKDINNQTFIFSLNLMKKYNMIKKDGYGIYCSKGYGPVFGNGDFRLNKDMKQGETYANKHCNFFCDNNLELTRGKKESEYYEAEEIEVYKVIY